MIPHETIDRIYATAKIEEVIGDYVTLRRRGANLWGNCPFHDEKTPSFSVSPSKGIFKCFGCGKAGNVAKFVMEAEQCSYADALKQIAKKYHIEVKEKEQTVEEREAESERESLFKVNEWAREWFVGQLWQTEEGQAVGMQYFVERGLREETIRKFQLGYSPEKNALYYAAKKAGYKEEFLQKTGLCGISQYDDKEDGGQKKERWYDRFRDRVIFPIFTISGKTVAFAGRILKKKEHTGKYVNSPDSAIYSKQNELYGLYQAKQAISKQGMVYLVEGQMDVIQMHQSGVENVVSSGGTALTHRQVLLLHRLTENVTILYDGDAAGIHAALRGIDMLLEEGLNIKVVLLPDGEDPDSFARRMNAAEFQAYIKQNSQDFIRFKTNLLLHDAAGDPIRKSEVIKSIVQSIAIIPDLITRQVYIKDCAGLLGVREDALQKEIQKIRREKYRKPQDTASVQENASVEGESESTNTTEPASTPTKPAAQKEPIVSLTLNKGDRKLDENIKNILRLLVRYADRRLFEVEGGGELSVGAYVLQELESDGIKFENKLYERMLDELRQHLNDTDFVAENFFKYHQDADISALAAELLTDRYEQSRIWGRQNISENIVREVSMPTDEDRLQELVPHLVYELKDTILEEQIHYLREALKHASENGEDIMDLLMQINQLQAIRRILSDNLGKRVIR